MNSPLLASGLRRSLAQIRHVSPVLPGQADGLVGDVYAQAERDFGFVAPPLAAHSPAPGALAATWLMLRETLLANGSASRAQKEIVAAAVSVANQCPYCVAVHSAAAGSLVAGRGPAQIAAGQFEDVVDPGLRDTALWAQATGRPGRARPAPVSDFAELAGVAVTFHYINRMATIFLPESPLPPLTPKPMGGWVMGLLASAMTGPKPVPGASLELLPDAPLPAQFSWAASRPLVASALARAAAAVDATASGTVPEPVRALVAGRLQDWRGEAPGLDRSWADDSAAALSPADRPLGRLALLAAFAPRQVTKADVAATGPAADETLVAATSWASLAAARKIGSWL